MREEIDNPLEKESLILACLFRPSRSTYSQDVCEQLRPTCSINLPCHDMYKCSCPSRQSNFNILFGHCFSLGRRGNHVRVRACNVPSECKKYDWLRLLIIVMPKRTEGNPTFFPRGLLAVLSDYVCVLARGPPADPTCKFLLGCLPGPLVSSWGHLK